MFRVRLPRSLRRANRDERGQAVVEFALVLPLLCLLLFGIIQFGIAFYTYIDLTSATRDGARKAAVMRDSSTGVAAAQDAVKNATSAGDDNKLTVTVTPGQPWKTGDEVHVKASYPYEVKIMGVTFWSGPMVSESAARIE